MARSPFLTGYGTATRADLPTDLGIGASLHRIWVVPPWRFSLLVKSCSYPQQQNGNYVQWWPRQKGSSYKSSCIQRRQRSHWNIQRHISLANEPWAYSLPYFPDPKSTLLRSQVNCDEVKGRKDCVGQNDGCRHEMQITPPVYVICIVERRASKPDTGFQEIGD